MILGLGAEGREGEAETAGFGQASEKNLWIHGGSCWCSQPRDQKVKVKP